MIRRPPRSTPLYSSAASDVYKRQEMEGEVKGEMVPHFWYKVTPMSASDIHTRRIGLATRNQSALFMMSINWYYVECLLHSVDSTAKPTCKSATARHWRHQQWPYIYMDDVIYILQLELELLVIIKIRLDIHLWVDICTCYFVLVGEIIIMMTMIHFYYKINHALCIVVVYCSDEWVS